MHPCVHVLHSFYHFTQRVPLASGLCLTGQWRLHVITHRVLVVCFKFVSRIEPVARPLGELDPDTASGGSRPVGQVPINLGQVLKQHQEQQQDKKWQHQT